MPRRCGTREAGIESPRKRTSHESLSAFARTRVRSGGADVKPFQAAFFSSLAVGAITVLKGLQLRPRRVTHSRLLVIRSYRLETPMGLLANPLFQAWHSCSGG